MIAIENQDGELVKIITTQISQKFGFHSLFGFIGEDKARERLELRRRQGFDFSQDDWKCEFNLLNKNGSINIDAAKNCSLEKIDGEKWKLITKMGDFILTNKAISSFSDVTFETTDELSWSDKLTKRFLYTLFLIAPIAYLLMQTPAPIEEEIKKELDKPITVTIVKPKQAVNIQKKQAAIKVKPLSKSDISKRAVRRNLGFLGLVGSTDNKKVVGGVPQKLKAATAGAGKGGDAGSGGEVLTGLGKGLKKTTVGNTGVAGLGGIGTKGAGGGLGGYGNTMVASGEGVGISAVSVSSNDMVIDGGLSRYVINATIAKYLGQVRRCYENQLKMNPGLEGLVTVNFEINALGTLNFSKVKNSTLKNAATEGCITNKMMSWKFPKPKGGVKVNINYPFMLRPVGS